MTDLRTAAQQALEALEANRCNWEEKEKALSLLRAALAEPTGKENLQVGCDRCRSPLWAGTKCDVCGRKA